MWGSAFWYLRMCQVPNSTFRATSPQCVLGWPDLFRLPTANLLRYACLCLLEDCSKRQLQNLEEKTHLHGKRLRFLLPLPGVHVVAIGGRVASAPRHRFTFAVAMWYCFCYVYGVVVYFMLCMQHRVLPLHLGMDGFVGGTPRPVTLA